MTVTFRDFQVEAIAAVRRDWLEVSRALVVMATGTGKTHTFLGVLDAALAAGELGRALIIAHRRELIHQPLQRMRTFFPALAEDAGIVMAEENDYSARVIVATVQSLADPRRVAAILEHGPITHLVIDEVHHVTAQSYLTLIAAFPGALVLGVTATPLRTDGDGLSKVFERVSYRLPISAAIRRGALVPFDALGVGLPISLDGIKETKDGWEREAMGDVLSAENVLEIVFQNWKQYAGNRQTIAFTASVAQAGETSDYFVRQGVRAEWVSGQTPKLQRDAILRRFQSGETQVVCNCMVLTEGFDAPETGAILMIAPTRSDLIYTQRLGRGLRTAEGKSNCVVLDFAPVENRNVVMAGDILGKPREVKKAEEQAERSGVLCALSIDERGEAATIDPSRLVVRLLNLLRKDSLAWTVGADYYATAALSGTDTLCIGLPQLERVAKAETLRRSEAWNEHCADALAYLQSYRLFHVNGSARLVGMFDSMDEAKGRADDIALEAGVETTLAQKKTEWRKEPITSRQETFLRSLNVPVPAGCTKGRAAQLITHTLAVQQVVPREQATLAALFRGKGVKA